MTNSNFTPVADVAAAVSGKLCGRPRLGMLAIVLLLGWASAPSRASVTLTPLLSFNGTNGDSPNVLFQGTDKNYYGTTLNGGANLANGTNGNGTVFRFTTNGVFNSLYSFVQTNGTLSISIQPVGLLQKTDGTLLGVADRGGTYNLGHIFTLATNGNYNILYSFDRTNGAFPKAGLTFNPKDGNYYGTTFNGGANSDGTVYQLKADGTFTSLFSFAGSNGLNPGPLTVGRDGNLYGMTDFGGTNLNNNGTVFRISTNGTFASLYSFDSTNSGANPLGGLLLASDGYFYGTTSQSGPASYGTVFRFDTNANFTLLASFNNTNGSAPMDTLLEGLDGNLYGTTKFGGTNSGYGTIFKVTKNGVLTSLYSFDNIIGAYPTCGLVQTSGTNFYGAAIIGGTNGGNGLLFKLTIAPAQPAQSPLLNFTQKGANQIFAWNSIPGQTYQLQSSSNLSHGSWTNNGPLITATSVTTSVTNAAGTNGFANSSAYYRLLVPAQ